MSPSKVWFHSPNRIAESRKTPDDNRRAAFCAGGESPIVGHLKPRPLSVRVVRRKKNGCFKKVHNAEISIPEKVQRTANVASKPGCPHLSFFIPINGRPVRHAGSKCSSTCGGYIAVIPHYINSHARVAEFTLVPAADKRFSDQARCRS